MENTFFPNSIFYKKRERLFSSLKDTISHCSKDKMCKEYLLSKYILCSTIISSLEQQYTNGTPSVVIYLILQGFQIPTITARFKVVVGEGQEK